jgi:hypothetical protein
MRYPSKYHFLIIIGNIGLSTLFDHCAEGPLLRFAVCITQFGSRLFNFLQIDRLTDESSV